jgi:hypothetical protein
MKYAEIKNNEIIHIHLSLPRSYKNISNFYVLSDEQLKDLTWSNNLDTKFYKIIEQSIPENLENNQTLVGPSYVIDNENALVYSSYDIETIPEDYVVPQSITATQIRLWLIENNFSLSNIDNLIQSIEDQKTREKVMTEWEYAPYILRNHPFISTIGSALGLDDSQIDQAFIEASNIGN